MVSLQNWAHVSAQIATREAGKRAPARRPWHAIGMVPAAVFLIPLTYAVVAFVAFAWSL